MKLKGSPNELVTTIMKQAGRRRTVPLFKFDENGIAEINEQDFTKTQIDRLKQRYETLDKDIKKEVKEPKKAKKKPTTRVCKTCGAEFESQGQLLAHYRKEHPKK